MTFLMILYSTCTGPFWGGVTNIGVLYFGTRNNICLLVCVLLVLICRTHLNIYGGSLRFLYILSLRLYVTHFNLRTVLLVFLFLLFSLYEPPTVSSVTLTLLGQWLYNNTGVFHKSSGVTFDCSH